MNGILNSVTTVYSNRNVIHLTAPKDSIISHGVQGFFVQWLITYELWLIHKFCYYCLS